MLLQQYIGYYFCGMESRDLLWISITVNACAVLFFSSRGAIGVLLAYWREVVDDKSIWRSVAELHEDQAWRLPRLCLDIAQGVTLTVIGVAILCVDHVARDPFTGSFGDLTASGFAIAIGVHIYRTVQDTILHAHLKHYKVDLVHHLVVIAIYCVFLSFRQNALFGTIGLLCTGSVPSVEISRLLKTIAGDHEKSTSFLKLYHNNLIIGVGITFILRLVIPLVFCIYGFATSNPLMMAVPVVAFFFTSLMFFGAVNFWLCGTSAYALWKMRRTYFVEKCALVLDTESGATFTTKSSKQSAIVAKKNQIGRLTPCANINLSPQTSSQVRKVSNNIAVTNTYVKQSVNDALNPLRQVLPLRSTNPASSDSGSSEHSNRSSGEIVTFLNDSNSTDNQRSRVRVVRFLTEPQNIPETPSSSNNHTKSSQNLMPPSALRQTVGQASRGPNVRLAESRPTSSVSVTSSSTVTSSSDTVTSSSSTMTASSTALTLSSFATSTPNISTVPSIQTLHQSGVRSNSSSQIATLGTHASNPNLSASKYCVASSRSTPMLPNIPIQAPSTLSNAPNLRRDGMEVGHRASPAPVRRGSVPEIGRRAYSMPSGAYKQTRSLSCSTDTDI